MDTHGYTWIHIIEYRSKYFCSEIMTLSQKIKSSYIFNMQGPGLCCQ